MCSRGAERNSPLLPAAQRMAAHLRPRGQTTTTVKGIGEPSSEKPAAGKCSGLLGSVLPDPLAPLKKHGDGGACPIRVGAQAHALLLD